MKIFSKNESVYIFTLIFFLFEIGTTEENLNKLIQHVNIEDEREFILNWKELGVPIITAVCREIFIFIVSFFHSVLYLISVTFLLLILLIAAFALCSQVFSHVNRVDGIVAREKHTIFPDGHQS